MTKERELLARAGLIIAQYRWSDPEDKALRELSQQINEYFEEPEPEQEQESTPIVYWDTQAGTLIPAVPLSSERTCFKVPLVPLYLNPAPRPEFVRLSDDEIRELWSKAEDACVFARDIEGALEEKNNAF